MYMYPFNICYIPRIRLLGGFRCRFHDERGENIKTLNSIKLYFFEKNHTAWTI